MVKLKNKSMYSFFKRDASDNGNDSITSSSLAIGNSNCEDPDSVVQHEDIRPSKIQKVTHNEFDMNSLERDPGKRPQICDYPVNQRDAVRRAYLNWGPYQKPLTSYPLNDDVRPRRFQPTWFKVFPSWLEYSPTKDAAYCLFCYLFPKESGRFGTGVFTSKGFRSWKKVNDGKNCAFLKHIGEDNCSPHNKAVKACQDLLDQSIHIRNVIEAQGSDTKLKNRLRLKTSIDVARWLTVQACALRGHDETHQSKNKGNFLEMIELLAWYNEDVKKVVLDNAPFNSKYISPSIQKEILHILANKVRNHIRQEVGNSKFCIIVDEARDESKKEQMALVLRFVDDFGFIQERFFDLVHVKDTTSLTLKEELCAIFSRHELEVSKIRGQGYDGASNMRGEWNGLQALFLADCPYAYYVHCFAHRLQLALVAASREVIPVHQFFSHLLLIVNLVCSSSKRHDELQAAKLDEIAHLLDIGELETGRGVNQIGTLKRPVDTRWGSHFSSICSLINMYDATCSVLQNIIQDGANYSQRGDADFAYNILTSFEFILILHFMKELMGITDILCQTLQQQSQDIVNATHLVQSTKTLIQTLRTNGWEDLIKNVKLFCEKHTIDMPDFNASYVVRQGRSRQKKDHITMEHHFRVDIFLATMDKQILELNHRFNNGVIELLTLSSALVPKDGYKNFNIENICNLVEKYYPIDFNEQEKINLKVQLNHFILDAREHPKLQNLSTIPELCRALVDTNKSQIYYLLDRLIRLILTLPVSTATSERSFSAMKILKTRLRNKMNDEFLADSMIIYIEREIAEGFTSESIIDDFKSLKERRAIL